MCVYLFLWQKWYLCGLIRDCAFINSMTKRMQYRIQFFKDSILQCNFHQVCWSDCNSYLLETYFFLDLGIAHLYVWCFCHPVHLFGPVRLFSSVPDSNLCAYSGLCVYLGVESTQNSFFECKKCLRAGSFAAPLCTRMTAILGASKLTLIGVRSPRSLRHV